MEEKHQHAREALEHFRTASREQRDREARQHEQHLQFLQAELRTTGDALNGRHSELRNALQEKAEALTQLTATRAEKRQVDELLRQFKPAAERLAAQTQVVEDLREHAALAKSQYETLQAQTIQLGQLNVELERQLAAAGAAAQSQEQLVREVLARIGAGATSTVDRPRSRTSQVDKP